MATSLEILEKEVQIVHLHPKKTLSFGEKIAIGPPDLEIIFLQEIIKKRRRFEKNRKKLI